MTALETTLHNWHPPGWSLFLSEQIRHAEKGLAGDSICQIAKISDRILPSALR